MADADLLVTHAHLATLRGPAGPRKAEAASDVGLLEDAAVAVRDGRIAWVGPAGEWGGSARRVLDAGGRLVTPGYVDAHTHAVYAGDRAFEVAMRLAGRPYLEILEAGGGIAYTTRRTRQASLGELTRDATKRLARMLHNGSTLVECKSGYALETEGELRMLEAGRDAAAAAGVAAVHTFLGAHAVPEEFRGRTEDYVDAVVDEMLPRVERQGIARFCDVFVEEGVFTVEQGQRILEAGRRHGLVPRLHADEIVDLGGASLAARTGCASADHLLAVGEAGIQAMADAGTTAVLLPTVPITLMQPKWAPGRALLEAGVPVALASDHNPNNPVTDMSLVAQLGAYLLGLSPAQALTAVTWNAACSLHQEAEAGSVEVGKRADLLVHDVAGLDHWVYEVGRSTVRHVVAAGRWVR